MILVGDVGFEREDTMWVAFLGYSARIQFYYNKECNHVESYDAK